jgi:putative membrane protein
MLLFCGELPEFFAKLLIVYRACTYLPGWCERDLMGLDTGDDMKHVVIVLSVAALITGCASRQEKGAPGSGSGSFAGADSAVSTADSTFAAQACQSGTTEMEIGKLAASNTKNAAVRDFAKRLSEDHAKAEKELAQLFSQKGIPQERQLAPQFQSSLNRLAALRGGAFDAAFKQQVIQDEEKAIELFETQLAQGTDAELKAFAQRHLPQLREHLATARQLEVSAESTAESAPAAAAAPTGPIYPNPASRLGNTPK